MRAFLAATLPRNKVRLGIAAFALLVIASIWAGLFFYVRHERERQTDEVIRANTNLVEAFKQHTLRTFNQVDQITLLLKGQVERRGTRLDLSQFSRDAQVNRDLIAVILLIDEHGNSVVADNSFRSVNIADREHFRVHAENDSGQLFIGKPVMGRVTGKSSISVTRRINKSDGSFGGVVLVSIDPTYFSNFYRSIDLGRYGVVTLIGRDGIIRSRLSGLTADVGQDLGRSPVMRAVETSERGNLRFRSVVDNIDRLWSYSALSEYPLIVNLGVAESEALAASDRLRSDSYLGAAAWTFLVLGLCSGLLLLVNREQRTLAALERSNADLAGALATLQRAQAELVRSGKLAALGSLVAGVAHELNTPIGNALTVASFLQEKSEQFEREVQSETVRRSTLSAYTADSAQGCALIIRSLTHAAELVMNFKQVAVDQASAKRRRFDLKEVIDEVLATLNHLVKNKPIAVRTRLAEGMTMDSYPGPLGQVLSNLFINALTHAFEGRVSGEIAIVARREGEDRVVLEFRDDGKGIARENLSRIFDPFFTTRMGQGGSGLGLNIAHNIVTGMLGGRIDVASVVGEGTIFTIELPRVAPLMAEPGEAE
jgi:signal transduction histidine kinase